MYLPCHGEFPYVPCHGEVHSATTLSHLTAPPTFRYNTLDPASREAALAKMLPFLSRDFFTCFACSRGHYTSLVSLLGNVPSLERSTVSPAQIPTLWATADPDIHERVLSHCETDARILKELYTHACRQGSLTRTIKGGGEETWVVGTDDDGSVVRPAWKALEQFTQSPPAFRRVNVPKQFEWAGTYDWS